MIFNAQGGSSDLNGFLDAGSHVEGNLKIREHLPHRRKVDR